MRKISQLSVKDDWLKNYARMGKKRSLRHEVFYFSSKSRAYRSGIEFRSVNEMRIPWEVYYGQKGDVGQLRRQRSVDRR